MNNNWLVCYDFETIAKLTKTRGQLNADTVEPAQLAAVAIDPTTMEICKWAQPFDSLMCPEGDWRDRIDPGALRVNRLNPDDIAKAPPRKEVWHAFAQWCLQFNPKGKGVTSNPIPCGKNIRNFDQLIVQSLSERYETVDKQGIQTLFHRRRLFDLEDMLWHWFEGQPGELKNLTMDEARVYFGLKGQGHQALIDTLQTAEMICRFLKLKRKLFRSAMTGAAVKLRPFRGSMVDYRLPAFGGPQCKV